MPAHLVPLGGGWGLWRWFCVRAAGFPVDLLEPLADPDLAALADAVNAGGDDDAYRARFRRAERNLARALHGVAADPGVREAVAWQNPGALDTGFDTLLRRDPETVPRTGRHRKTEALVTSYLHRYCAKNDTIGFFGPLRWARIDPEQTVPVRAVHDGTTGDRTLYLEGWALAALGRALAPPLRPWLVPRLLPLLDVDGDTLRVPLADPVPLDPVQAAVLRALRPDRTARQVVAAVCADPTAPTSDPARVRSALDRLHGDGRIEWTLETAPDDLRAAATMRTVVTAVDDPAVRAPALAALDRLTSAAATVAAARGDATAVRDALAGLGATFTELTGEAPVREAGQLYAGRTLVFEECRRPDSIRLGRAALDTLAAPLTLLLESARWYTAAGAALYRRALRALFDQLAAGRAGAPVPLAELWLAARGLLIDDPGPVVRPLTRALHHRWERLLAPGDERRVWRAAADLRTAAAAAFPAGPSGWPAAAQHSPDLMIAAPDLAAIAAGDVDWVLGELHPGYHTMRYASWVDCHPDPAELARAMAADLPGGVVRIGATGGQGGSATRFSPRLLAPEDQRLVFAPDTCGHDPGHDLVVGGCDVVDRDGRLLVRRRADGACHDLLEVFADLVAANLMPHFRLLSPAPHRPRVTIDRLVVSRESWTFPAAAVDFAGDLDEPRRFRRLRAWAGRHGLPRHVFVRCTGERKPVHVDLASLASVEVLCRAARRAQRTGGACAEVAVTEMLPDPGQLWFTDADGRRHSCELRVVAAPLPAGRPA
ncbi:lantibiotic dehydratase [Micromonospora sagamiensis]|uniref:Lantibiotic biosynthesis dehydratase-like protein n=1 Tax=Micromonospora sagamiensis TaxID=47875 RepID=A0A562WH79_9ACTN|nr:lantibiotic dehydratase [Micromonospora sagamiensis]TWJ29670.1 lantibiotic biosynthesis dehydratase-like protein [Micromonospora sagamiensis]BCL17299.1 lantibiotic dehydratase [Micromonospora sagamiensis]